MPNRIIKESICTSDNIDALSAFNETVFYRLIVNCDDFGRMDARPKILASRLFPLREIRVKQMEDALRALTSAELVTVYIVGGKPFLQMNTWDRHQNVRAKKSRYPGLEDAESILHASDCNCTQMHANVPVIQSNPIQSESLSESESTRADARETGGVYGEVKRTVDNRHYGGNGSEAFEQFWAAYPRKIGKAAARTAWQKVKVPVSVLIEAVERQKGSDQWSRDGGRYIPNAATWLNQGRWEDELPEAAVSGKSRQDQYQRHGQQLSPIMRQAVERALAEEGGRALLAPTGTEEL